MNIEIKTPSYIEASGGIRVLHYLGYLCHLAGHRVFMNCEKLNDKWGIYSNPFDFYRPYISIIPEIYPISFDDPYQKTVRWVLYFPSKLCNGPKYYPKHEYVVSYHQDYKAESEIAAGKKCPVFYLPYVDMIGFNDDILRENRGAVWYGKGHKIITSETQGLPEITRIWPSPRIALIHFLKSIDTLYSHDPFSAINKEALICGAKVKLWNGSFYENYFENEYENVIMNIEHDLVLANNFILQISKYFKL